MKNATLSYQISYIGWLFTFLLAPALMGQLPSALAQRAEGPGFRQGPGMRPQGGGHGPQAFRQGFQGRPSHRDRDNNPPGQMGGPGTNWENRPGPQGGAGPDFRGQGNGNGRRMDKAERLQRFDTDQDGRLNQEEKYAAREQRQAKRAEFRERADVNQDGQIDQQEKQQARAKWLEEHPEMRERLGANQDGQINKEDRQAARQQWLEEHPELKERLDANQDGTIDQTEKQEARRMWQQPQRDRDNNPPGRRGGRGTNWENRPGLQGGPGASPNLQAEPAATEPAAEPAAA